MAKRELKYWRLLVRTPDGHEDFIDLRKRRFVSVGDDEQNDVCLPSLDVPFRFRMLTRSWRTGEWKLDLTEEAFESLEGSTEKLKDWKTRLYSGRSFKLNGTAKWKIGSTQFELQEADVLELEPFAAAENQIEKKQFRQAFSYSFGFYLAIALIFMIISFIRSLFFVPTELAVQKITVIEAEKVLKKNIPVEVVEIPVEEVKPEPVKEKPKKVEKRAPQKAAKAKKVAQSTAGKTQGKKPRNIKNMGLLAIQTTPGTSRVALAAAAPQVIDQTADANTPALGLGKATAGVGIGDSSQHVAKIASISGKGYEGGLGNSLGTGKIPSLTLVRREVEVRGALDPAVIRQIIEERLTEIRYCYENALLKHTNLAGKISASWTIGADGSVANIKSASQEIKPDVLHPCVKEQIARWKFPNPKGGGIVHVKYPFLFNPVGGSQ